MKTEEQLIGGLFKIVFIFRFYHMLAALSLPTQDRAGYKSKQNK